MAVGVGVEAGELRGGGRVVELGDGGDVGLLAGGGGRGGAGEGDGGEASLQLRRRLEAGGEGIAPCAESDAPLGDGAGGVLGEDFVEGLGGGAELEGVHEGDGPVDAGLHGGGAGRGEGDGAEFFGGGVVGIGMGGVVHVVHLLGGEGERENDEHGGGEKGMKRHGQDLNGAVRRVYCGCEGMTMGGCGLRRANKLMAEFEGENAR